MSNSVEARVLDQLTAERCLPNDGTAGTLVGRAWVPGHPPGPAVVLVREEGLFDISAAAPTLSGLLEADDPAATARGAGGMRIAGLEDALRNSASDARDPARPFLLAPADLQPVKAAGVTFVKSMLERVIEEQARGDADKAEAIRAKVNEAIGTDLRTVQPGSEAAQRLKEHLIEVGAWSQYLEVGIGPDAEIFTKAPPMAAVGTGAAIGIHPKSSWNNPEPEVVLAVNSKGRIVGATLGNDVNLRDVEGRSALLLGKAKDNNASCAIGPFVRLFDATFGLDDVRRTDVRLEVAGADGFRMQAVSSMAEISRDPTELVENLMGPHHQYPDGAMLMCGTMFAPTDDRGEPGRGFTHKEGDLVTIAADELGSLVNRVGYCDRIPPWTFGTGALMKNLAARGLL
jgi:fumarylacetoacetate (FAA) hydrolase family protein